eukprot:RCo046705
MASAQAPSSGAPPRHGGTPKHLKAMILVGGFGTRLRPLTLSVPKSVVPFANVPMIVHQIRALKEVGCVEVVLAVAYKPEQLKKHMDDWEVKLGIKISYSEEKEPLGTAGPLALARPFLLSPDDSPFFVLNSDITCTYPLKELLSFHLGHGKEGTIMATKVENPSIYGVIVSEPDGSVQRFVEKPQVFVSNRINAGLYILNPAVLDRIKVEPTSIEKQTFPAMADAKQLMVMDLEGHWMDIGQPKDYLLGIPMYLSFLSKSPATQGVLAQSNATYEVQGHVLLAEDVKVGAGSVLGPNVTVAQGCVIGEGTRLQNCALLDKVVLGRHCWVNQAIIGWNSRIGDWCHVEGGAVFGEDVTLKPGLVCVGTKVLPNKGLDKSYLEPTVVM